MKIQNIYHLLQAALLLLLVSCTQEEFPAVQDKAQQLTISVTDGGYTSAVENMKTRIETRAVENGYTTEFTEGDACGLYVVRGEKTIYSNVKLTAERDAATGSLVWKPEAGTTLAGGLSDEHYYLYYPYQTKMDYQTAAITGSPLTAAEFFAPLIAYWWPQGDQSTYAAYTASDLMTASCTPTLENGKLRLDFVMAHELPLVVIEMPKTVYKFTDARIPDYTVPSAATFTSAAEPLRMADGTYRYLVPPSMPAIWGSYDDGDREFTINTSAHTLSKGEYKRYKVDGAVKTIRNYILQVGDFFLADGNLMPNYADAREVRTVNVVGIVFQTDPKRIGQAEKNKLGGNVHGLVMAVKNATTFQSWGLFGTDEDLAKCETKARNYSDISGYGNCEHIRANRGNFDRYPAFKAADGYNTTCPVPTTTTGWYLPASGQWWDILQNLGGCTALAKPDEQASSQDDDFGWSGQGDVPAALNAWMEKIATDSKDNFRSGKWFWSSSEYSEFFARYWYVQSNGRVGCYWDRKDGSSVGVRPVLAF